jgi:hypothetical protein
MSTPNHRAAWAFFFWMGTVLAIPALMVASSGAADAAPAPSDVLAPSDAR